MTSREHSNEAVREICACSEFLLRIMAPSQLEIKVKALQRLLKERDLYLREIREQRELLDSMRSANSDGYEVKKQTEVLGEAKRMIPELERKIQDFKNSLSSFLESYVGDEDTTTASKLIM